MQRDKILERLNAKVEAGKPILGVGAGSGLSAKAAEAGGADLIIIYNSGRFRMAGRGSLAGALPYGDANAIVMEMAGEVLPVVTNVPVIAGVCGTDPFRSMDRFLAEVVDKGFSGIQNFPTVGLYDGLFRTNLEETGMGFELEVDMVRLASSRQLFTTPYAFNEDEAAAMTGAGADLLVAHCGLTTSGLIGAKTTMPLDQAAVAVQRMHDAATSVRSDVLVVCHGGPIASPGDAAFIFEHTKGVAGFYGASSIERLAAERAIEQQASEFANLSLS